MAVTVAVKLVLASKSGAETKLNSPSELIASSVPETLNVTAALSVSVAVTVPIEV